MTAAIGAIGATRSAYFTKLLRCPQQCVDCAAQLPRRALAAVTILFACVIVGTVGWYNQNLLKHLLKEQYHWHMVMRPSVVTAAQAKELAAKPSSDFKECTNGCPTMVVVPAGKFMMGSPESTSERPQHEVTIAKPFAVRKTDVTFAEWDICVAAGACPKVSAMGRGLLARQL